MARVAAWAMEHGYSVEGVVTEVGSALNGKRRKFLSDPNVITILVEHRDRFARFGTAGRSVPMFTITTVRPHQGIHQSTPKAPPVEPRLSIISVAGDLSRPEDRNGPVRRRDRLGGLIHGYEWT